MVTYKLDYMGGGAISAYHLLKYTDTDTEVGVEVVGIIHDAKLAHRIQQFLNAENDNQV